MEVIPVVIPGLVGLVMFLHWCRERRQILGLLVKEEGLAYNTKVLVTKGMYRDMKGMIKSTSSAGEYLVVLYNRQGQYEQVTYLPRDTFELETPPLSDEFPALAANRAMVTAAGKITRDAQHQEIETYTPQEQVQSDYDEPMAVYPVME